MLDFLEHYFSKPARTKTSIDIESFENLLCELFQTQYLSKKIGAQEQNAHLIGT